MNNKKAKMLRKVSKNLTQDNDVISKKTYKHIKNMYKKMNITQKQTIINKHKEDSYAKPR